jgi:hypothetical protein
MSSYPRRLTAVRRVRETLRLIVVVVAAAAPVQRMLAAQRMLARAARAKAARRFASLPPSV